MSRNSTRWPTALLECRLPVILLALALILTSCASPATPGGGPTKPAGNGIISGQVVGKDGPVTGALVQLSSLTDDACAAANDQGLDLDVGQSDADIELLKRCRDQFGRVPTDENGHYRFEAVPPGKYAIWILWEQNKAPDVPLHGIPQPGYFFTTLSVEMVGTYRVDVSMHEDTPGVYEVDVAMPSFDFSGEGELVIDFNW